MKQVEFVIKEDAAFRLRVKKWKCQNPSSLNAIEFIQECKDKDGEVDFTSTYQFFMTNEELQKLAKEIVNE